MLGAAGTPPVDALAPLGSGVPVYADPAACDASSAVVVAVCPPSGTTRAAHEMSRTADWALTLVREWLAQPHLARTRLVFVTCDAVDPADEGVHADRDDARPGAAAAVASHAPVWGLVRSALREHPGRFALIDVDDHPDSHAALPALLADSEPEAAVRRGTVYVPKLVPLVEAAPKRRPRDPDGTVLVTGGTGSLGMLVARHLVTAQAAAVRAAAAVAGGPVVLLGRSAGGWVAHAVAERLESEGAAPTAVVLVDTCPPVHGDQARAFPGMASDVLRQAAEFAASAPARLTAMARYFELFANWTPTPLACPTLYVRAEHPLPDTDPPPQWSLPHTEVTVPGDHFTLVDQHAHTTAEAIHTRLTDSA
ncbi:thioesterase domain-containing protein [Embleya sp. NPDC020630]|uniref:SpnB-like Rossmann fold domain-containing protein n=1 Tax=Embleya sp. NPDC020630 TaxID=3363979 RepID=UPI00379D9C1D